MIGARLAPSLPSAPDLVRSPRGETGGGPASTFNVGRGPEAAERTGRSERPAADRPDRTGRDFETERAGRAERSERADRRNGTGRTERDEDADSFERMVDRDGTRAPETQRATATEPAAPDSRRADPASDNTATAAGDVPGDALPGQLLAMLSTLAPSTAASSEPAAVTTSGAGTASALPTLTLPTAASTGPVRADGMLAAPPTTGATNPTDTAAALAAVLPQAAETAAAAGTKGDTVSGFDALLREAPEASAFTSPATASTVAPRTAAVPQLAPVALPADPQAGFDDAFGSRIVWMAEQRLGHADIRVTPDHLGTIDVRLQLDGAKVSAEFYSQQPEVRQALEASFGRLRDLLGQQGLQLAHADVGQQRSGQGEANASEPGSAHADADVATPASVVIRSRRLLDEIA